MNSNVAEEAVHHLEHNRRLQLLIKNNIPAPFDSILDAVLTVSPNKQYRGIVNPTMPENKHAKT